MSKNQINPDSYYLVRFKEVVKDGRVTYRPMDRVVLKGTKLEKLKSKISVYELYK